MTSIRVSTLLLATFALAFSAARAQAAECGNLGSVSFNLSPIQGPNTPPPAPNGITVAANGYVVATGVSYQGGNVCLSAGSYEITSNLSWALNGYQATAPGSAPVYSFGTTNCTGTTQVTCSPSSFGGTFYKATGIFEGIVLLDGEPVVNGLVTAGYFGYQDLTDSTGQFQIAVSVEQGWAQSGSTDYKVWWNDCKTNALAHSGEVVTPADLHCFTQPPLECSPSVGKPVNVLTGNVWLTQTDVSIPGIAGLSFVRTYNSDNAWRNYGGMLGRGWHSTYDISIIHPKPRVILLRGANGSPMYFGDPDANSDFEPVMPVDEHSHIVQTGNGYTRFFDGGGREEFNTAGKLTLIVDASNNATVLARDIAGRLTTVTDPGGRALTFEYDAGNRLERLAGSMGLIALFEHDASGYLSAVTYPDGSGYTFAYGTAATLTEVRDHSGRIVEQHTYDGSRGLTSELGDGVEKYTITYEDFRSVVTDALGNETVYEYNMFRGVPKLTKRTGPCSSCGGSGQAVEEWTYDDAGRVLTHKDANGNVESFTYDTDGNLLTHTNQLNQTTTSTYDAQGRMLTQARPGGSLTTYTHGPAGPLTITEKVSATENRTTSIAYTAQGKPQTITDPRNKVTTLAYAGSGDLQSVADPLSHATSFGYDASGRRTTVTDAPSHTTTTSYDLAGRVSRVTSHDGTYTEFTYDLRGHRTSVRDTMGRLTHYLYDPYGRLDRVVDPLNQVTRYGYDLMGNLTSLTDAKGQTTSFEYDAYSRAKKVIYPGGAFESFAYDTAGRLQTKTDRNNVTTTYSYDALGRLTGKTYNNGDPAVSYTYDVGGRLLTAGNGTDSLTWTYDLAGQLLSEQSTRNASTVAYTYDAAGNRLSVSLDGQVFVTYAYDDASRLMTINRGSNVFGFGYDNANRRTSMMYPNGANTSYSYDTLNRLTRLKADKGATPITDFQYLYDAAGNRTRKQQLDYTEDYEYDVLYRLTGVTRSGGLTGLWQYGYDSVGNRTYEQKDSSVTSYSYNEKNQLLSTTGGGPIRWRGTLSEPGQASFTSALVNGQPARMLQGNVFEADLQMQPGSNTVTVQATDVNGNIATKQYQVTVAGSGATYTYDPNGNLSQKVEGADTWVYEWTAENQLKRVTKNGVEQARFAYDALRRRVEKVTGGVITTFAHEGADILRETAGGTLTLYVHGPGIDEPLAREAAGMLTAVHADGLGSVTKVTDSTGVATGSARYTAFGSLETGALGTYGFTGREPDLETGLAYYRARYYSSAVGRFVGEDPLGFQDGTNFYAYVGNRPVIGRDPSGRSALGIDVACAEAQERLLKDKNRQLAYGGLYDPREPRYNHCLFSCVIKKACGTSTSVAAGLGKEAQDVWGCLSNPSARGCETAWQPSDVDIDNPHGLTCPANRSCHDRCKSLLGAPAVGPPGPLYYLYTYAVDFGS